MGALRDLPPEWIAEAFTPASSQTGDDELELDPVIRRRVVFMEQDLRREMPDGPFHLILCRNLAFTYLDEALRRETLKRLRVRLVPGGVLVLGAHETLPGEGQGVGDTEMGRGESDSAIAGESGEPPVTKVAARFRRLRPGEPVYRLEMR